MIVISSQFLSVVNEWLVAQGYGAAPECARLRQLQRAEYAPLGVTLPLLSSVATLTGDRHVFLRIGQAAQWHHLGALGHMLRTARVLEELLNGYVYYEQLFYGQSLVNVTRTESVVALFWQIPVITPPVAQLTMATFAHIAHALVPDQQSLAEVRFPFPAQDDEPVYEHALGCPVHFGGDRLLIGFHRSALYRDLDFSRVDSGPLLPQADVLHELPDTEFRRRLYGEVLAALPMRKADLNGVASALAMSPRTLQRRLQGVPDGFRGVVYRVRMRMAQHYLLDHSMSLASIALLLGYSEQSAFQLAFKKYVGITPGEWRDGSGMGLF